MSYIITFFAICFGIEIVYGAGGNAVFKQNWDYSTMGGPNAWKNTFPVCGYRKQSPVNILSDDVIYNKDLDLELHNYEDTAKVSFQMKNRRSDIEFAAEGSDGVPQAVTFQGTKYRLYQFHFHWGSTSFQGSEHLLDSQQYAAEMHVIHYNDKYPDVGKAIAQPDGLLVWGHFLKVSSDKTVHNEAFQKLLNNFGKANKCCEKTELTLNLKALLPDNSEEFYHYNGSLTTPPCYESVKWIVNRNPLLVSEKQMDAFRLLKTNSPASTAYYNLANNYRPAMPLNDRVVHANFNTGANLKPITGLIISFIVLLYSMM